MGKLTCALGIEINRNLTFSAWTETFPSLDDLERFHPRVGNPKMYLLFSRLPLMSRIKTLHDVDAAHRKCLDTWLDTRGAPMKLAFLNVRKEPPLRHIVL